MWGTLGDGDGRFEGPLGSAVGSSGNIYVSDNCGIQKFTSSGTFITKWGSVMNEVSWGSKAGGDGEFWYPFGVAVDSSENVYKYF